MAVKAANNKLVGRPSTYSEKVADEICGRIAEGESTRAICREEGMPALRTVFQWLAKNEQFAQRYARARLEQADAYQMMIVDEAFSAIDPQIGRLRVDALKWVASKLAPKKYGERIEHEVSGDLDITVTIGGNQE